MQKKVAVVPAAVLPDRHSDNYVATTCAWKKVPVRHGNILAWISDSALYCYNLQDGQRTRTALAITRLHPSQCIAAFDGKTVVVFRFAFDATTGRIVYEDPEKPPFLFSAFALHHQFAYFFRDGHLMAADLTDGSSQKNLVDVQQSLASETGTGLIVWSEKSGRRFPGWRGPRSIDAEKRSLCYCR